MPSVINITAPGDPRVAPYVSIRERDLTGRGDRFIVEGRVTLETLIRRSRFEIESLFLAETKVERLAPLLETLPKTVPVYQATQAVMDGVAGFPMHRGVLACARKTPADEPEKLLRACAPGRCVVVGAGLSNHDNVGALFRNAAAFGAGAVLLDEACCDPLYRKAIRVSAGASLWLPFARTGTAMALLHTLKAADWTVWSLTPRDSASSLWSMPVPNKLALVLGPEGPGLAPALIDAATAVRIPMITGFDSINVATAAGIALAWVHGQR